jgi:hypothetical protein
VNLSQATSDELVRELVQRPTFAGCVVWFTGDSTQLHFATDDQIMLSKAPALRQAGIEYLLVKALQQLASMYRA